MSLLLLLFGSVDVTIAVGAHVAGGVPAGAQLVHVITAIHRRTAANNFQRHVSCQMKILFLFDYCDCSLL